MAKKRSDFTELKAGREIALPQRGAKRLERARKAEIAYTEAAKDYQDGAKLMAQGLNNMLKASQGLLHIPASTQVVSRRAILNRASRWMEAQLFEACHRRLATATMARRMPRRWATRMPHAFSQDHFRLWVRSDCAASYNIVRSMLSPHLDTRPS